VTATVEPAVPAGAPAARYEDLPRPVIIRSAEDGLRFGVAAVVLLVCLGAEWYATRRVTVGQDDLVDFVSRLPEPIGGGVVGATQLAAVLAPIAILAMVLWFRSGRLALEAVIAGVLSAAAEIGLSRLVLDSAQPSAAPVGGFVDGWLGTPFPGAAYLAAAAGVATVALAWVSRGWRRAIWAVLLGVATLVVFTGNGFIVTTIAALAAGAAVGSLVVVALGGPDLAPRARAVGDALDDTGLAVVAVSELPSGRPPARHYRATLAGGADLFVKVLDDDARTRDLLARTWQRIRLRAVGDEQPVGSLRQAVEHEAFVALWAHRSGVRTPDVVAVQSVGRRGMLIAQRFVDGTPLDAVAPARIDSALVAAWRSLASLHGAGIARGPLDAPDFLVDAGEELWLVDMDHAGLGAPPGRMARDRADLLTSTAMAVGPDRAIAAASTGLGPIDLPFAQAGALYLGGSTIGDAVPVPGGLGATDAALIAGLAGAGVELAIATSCVLVYRLISYWLVIAPGWVCLEALRRLDYV
jgi:Lysylphosphatidylglycerol synthase TM region